MYSLAIHTLAMENPWSPRTLHYPHYVSNESNQRYNMIYDEGK
jgi:hypothetical protein